jgi:hypothetical protein
MLNSDLQEAGTVSVANNPRATDIDGFAGDDGGGPIFIATCPRSGSTLLRYVLDAHPELACPAEMNLSELCVEIVRCWGIACGDFGEKGPPKSAALMHANRIANEIMRQYANDRRWCEKSLTTALHLPLLAQVFPSGTFICLYRHPMDFVDSAIEASHWGFNAFGFAPYVARNPNNFVLSLLECWMDRVELMMAFEQNNRANTYRLYYELMVTEPVPTFSSLFKRIGHKYESTIIDRAFERIDPLGPGDRKIEFDTAIHKSSVGRGSRVPVSLVPDVVLARLNHLLGQLGYPLVDRSWNDRPSPLLAGPQDESEERTIRESQIEESLRGLVSRFSFDGTEKHALPTKYRIIIEDAGAAPTTWDFDVQGGRLERCVDAGNEVRVLLNAEVIESLKSGYVHPSVALDRGDIRIVALEGGGRSNDEAQRAVTRYFLRGIARDE